MSRGRAGSSSVSSAPNPATKAARHDTQASISSLKGRASQVFDLGDGRDLRRYKCDGQPHREAESMRSARDHGFSAAAVDDVRN
jgi:hypothetical protein